MAAAFVRRWNDGSYQHAIVRSIHRFVDAKAWKNSRPFIVISGAGDAMQVATDFPRRYYPGPT